MSHAPGRRWAPVTTKSFVSRFGLLALWLIEIVVFIAIAPKIFLNINTFSQLASSQASLVVLALAVVPTLAVGEIDLSVASVMGLGAIIFGQLNGVLGISPIVAIIVAVGTSAVAGLISGLITVLLRVQGLIVTLGMGTLALGITLLVSNSQSVGGVSPELSHFVNLPIGGVSVAFFIAIVLALVLWYVIRHMPLGRSMLFLGFNREVARLSGIRGNRLRILSFVAGSLIAGIAGVISIGVAGGADPTSFQPLLLPAFAATFLGTLVFTPGQVNPLGTVVSLYFLATGIFGIQVLGAGTWVSNVFYGVALVAIIAVSGIAANYGHLIGRKNHG
ncbi:ABC transporter permease [Glaciihabitans sp. UYNi722]|uniref:ABC transporter permease n=1 Tax=Glaciihabitans sp. UYNi722 TaxID=3156344 RepID=UPI00339390E3